MYAVLARKYTTSTKPTPNASESGTLRRGFLISPAVNVTLFHASAEFPFELPERVSSHREIPR
jgi:hypothetical protein